MQDSLPDLRSIRDVRSGALAVRIVGTVSQVLVGDDIGRGLFTLTDETGSIQIEARREELDDVTWRAVTALEDGARVTIVGVPNRRVGTNQRYVVFAAIDESGAGATDRPKARRGAVAITSLVLRFSIVMVEVTVLIAGGGGSIALIAALIHLAPEVAADVWLVFADALDKKPFEELAELMVRVAMVIGGSASVLLSTLALLGSDGSYVQPGHLVIWAAAVSLAFNTGAGTLFRLVSRQPGGRAAWRQSLHLLLDACGDLFFLAGVTVALWWADPAAGIGIGLLMILAAFMRHEEGPDSKLAAHPVPA